MSRRSPLLFSWTQLFSSFYPALPLVLVYPYAALSLTADVRTAPLQALMFPETRRRDRLDEAREAVVGSSPFGRRDVAVDCSELSSSSRQELLPRDGTGKRDSWRCSERLFPGSLLLASGGECASFRNEEAVSPHLCALRTLVRTFCFWRVSTCRCHAMGFYCLCA